MLLLPQGEQVLALQQVSGTTAPVDAAGAAVVDERLPVIGTVPRVGTHPKTCSLADAARGAKVLWVTSNGGHLTELAILEHMMAASPESVWVTFDTPQTQGFLQGRRHRFVEYVGPRDLGRALQAARRVAPLLRHEHFDLCVSTGAAVAATVLPLAALHGIPTYYVESLARGDGPSFTGRLLQRAPRVTTLTQYPEWASSRWPSTPSTLDGWAVADGQPRRGRLRVLVTLGTMRDYRFDRAVDAMLQILRPDDEVTWQLGCTSRTDLPGEVLVEVPQARLNAIAGQADVVVAHSGVGSVLQQLELGKSPVLAVRSAQHQEHVDDHQRQFARITATRGLTSVLDLDAPRRQVLEEAASRVVCRTGMRETLAPAA